LSSDNQSGCGFERIIDNEAGFPPPLEGGAKALSGSRGRKLSNTSPCPL